METRVFQMEGEKSDVSLLYRNQRLRSRFLQGFSGFSVQQNCLSLALIFVFSGHMPRVHSVDLGWSSAVRMLNSSLYDQYKYCLRADV